MKAVHFGAGNIGRGFIGVLLSEANYEITFVDVNASIITALNQENKYTVFEADAHPMEYEVKHVSGINNAENPEQVVKAIVEADIVTTAIGPNILPRIAPLIAAGIEARLLENSSPLNLIACENMVNASELLETEVTKHIDQKNSELFQSRFGFPNAAVDRIVPNQKQENILDVLVEPYYEWVVETEHLKGNRPDVPGITYVEALYPYIERKLFTVNTGHAAVAFTGYHYGLETIGEAIHHPKVLDMFHAVLKETGEALILEYGFDRQEHEAYQNKILNRFKNPHISDDIVRVARNPIQKLGPKERFIRPALMYYDHTRELPKGLIDLIAIVLKYDSETNEEAIDLQAKIKAQGLEKTLTEITTLAEEHPLLQAILAAYK